jgi:hypothetical protein
MNFPDNKFAVSSVLTLIKNENKTDYSFYFSECKL